MARKRKKKHLAGMNDVVLGAFLIRKRHQSRCPHNVCTLLWMSLQKIDLQLTYFHAGLGEGEDFVLHNTLACQQPA